MQISILRLENASFFSKYCQVIIFLFLSIDSKEEKKQARKQNEKIAGVNIIGVKPKQYETLFRYANLMPPLDVILLIFQKEKKFIDSLYYIPVTPT